MTDASAIGNEGESSPPPVPEHGPTTSEAKQKVQMEVAVKELEDRNVHLDLAKLTNEHHQLQQKYAQSERDKGKLSKENEKLEDKYQTFCSKASEQLRKADDRTVAAEETQRAWQLQAQEIAEELRQCKDELFSLQPHGGITDTQIAAEWDTLCQQITRWVDDEAEFASDLHTRLEELLRQNQLSQTIQKYWGRDRQLLVNRYKMNDELDFMLRYNIHCLLEDWVFDESIYLFGLRKDDARLLKDIENGLASLKPARDPARIAHWRSEALSAVLGLASFQDEHSKAANEVTREADDFITPLLPKLNRAAMKRFHAQITLPAISLACNLRCSPGQYYFSYGFSRRLHLPNRPALTPLTKGRLINEEELHQLNVVDIASRKTLKPNQALSMIQDGIIGEEIMLIHPGLCRRKGDGGAIILGKPVKLIRLLAPLPRKDKSGGGK